MTRKQKQILWTWFWRVAIVIVVILLVSISGNQQSIMLMQTDALDKLNEISVVMEPRANPITQIPDAEPVSLGTFTITHYSASLEECGKTDGITYTGTKATVNRTVAVDPDVIPLGSEILIDGQTYVAEDIGGAIKGNKIDIFVGSYQEAVQRGRVESEVWLAR